jgi:hypothetical protein
MRHFAIEQWVDLARGTSSDADRAAMESHLASGCARCHEVVAVLKGMTVIARAEKDCEPPESVVRLAKAAYRPPQHERLVARIMYDSFLEPLPAGVRTQDRVARHTLYEAGEYSLDVRVEQHGAQETATLVGQLANRKDPGAPADGVQVMLKSRKKVVATASCNAFGEFQLDYSQAPALQLEVCLGTIGQVLEVPLGAAPDESLGNKKAKPRGRSR